MPPRAKVNIREKGIRQAMEMLDAIGEGALDQRPTMNDLAKDAPDAISRVPHDTGKLEASLQDGNPDQYKRVTDYGYDIGTTVFYSRFAIRGTKYHKGQKPRIARKRLNDAAARAIAVDILRRKHPVKRVTRWR